EEPTAAHRSQHHEDHDDGRREGSHAAMNEQHGDTGREKSTDHVNVSMSEVEHLQDAVDERVTQRNKGVKAPGLQPVDQLLGEVLKEIVHEESVGWSVGPPHCQ